MTHSPTVGGLLKVGRKATFVRWFPSGEGWGSVTVEGRYLAAHDLFWEISVDGVSRMLLRDEWAVITK